MKRIGILAGTFDPVHKGHIAFALQALKDAKLDAVCFLPEIKPRRKAHVTHISHRIAMLELALKPYPKLNVLELPDANFSVAKTLPRLRQKFPDSELFFLIGADIELEYIPKWPLAERFLGACGLVIAQRSKTKEEVADMVKRLPKPPAALYIVGTKTAGFSSSKVREAAEKGTITVGMLTSTKSYIDSHWLYKTIP